MNNKYYTPEIDELFIGYECEVMWNVGYDYTWDPYIIKVKDEESVYGDLSFVFEMYDDSSTDIRTKYLDKEDIERCGWSYNAQYDNYTTGGVYMLTWWKLANKWSITNHNEPIYVGEIKSINELRKIMKFLNIK